MVKKKITLAGSRDIPFDKLVLSQANVRKVRAGVSIEELAEDIARRGLLQGLSVRAVLGEDGEPTGRFEIPAGGRRFRALEVLVKQKRLARNAPVPCIVREGGLAEEDSLAENVQRAPLHPLDQFRAFMALREKGQNEEEIAAAFFVSVAVVRQRLKLAAVGPRILQAYADGELTLEQVMAFSVADDRERQEQVFERLAQHHAHDRQPWRIRCMLTENAVSVDDKRVLFVGIDSYVEAGGAVMRDLFQDDEGGWLQDVALLERLVEDKLALATEAARAEGWKWVETALNLPFGATHGLRHLHGEEIAMTPEETAARDALQQELDRLEAEHAGADELPDAVDARLGEIERALEDFDRRPVRYEPEEIARAGVFVSVDPEGKLNIQRGFVRPADEPPIEPPIVEDNDAGGLAENGEVGFNGHSLTEGDDEAAAGTEPISSSDHAEPEEDEGLRPIPERLLAELTTHRTLALRHALGERSDIAFLAALHALCLRLFYRYAQDSCLELELRSAALTAQAPGLADTAPAQALDERHCAWSEALPREAEALWDALLGFDHDSRQGLFAHCVAASLNAVVEPYNRRPRAVGHADRLATALGLDMTEAGWAPTVDNFLGRVTKARILQAVGDACGERQAQAIAHLKKAEMAERAKTLLTGKRWLPEPLRTPHLPAEAPGDPTAVNEPVGNETVEAIAAE